MLTVGIGRTGLKVSQLCLGTMEFGSAGVNEEQSFALLDMAEEIGIDFLDVADVYPVPRQLVTCGRGEELIGRWLRQSDGRRHRIVVATKFGDTVGPGPNQTGGSRKHVMEACEASLRRLGTDHIDLYWMHKPDPDTPLDETLEALDRLVQAGKVLYTGASNFEAWRLAIALTLAAERRTVRFAAVQPRWSLLERRIERDLVPLCVAAGLAVIPYNPLAGGFLTGKYRRGEEAPPGSRFASQELGAVYQERYWNEAALTIIEILVAAAIHNGVTPAQIALSWLLARNGLTAPILGATRPEQLKENAATVGINLGPELVAELDNASKPFA